MENKHTRSVSLIDGHTEEMTDAEIKKALECCEVGKDKCRKCPFHCTVPACSRYLAQSALDLINRQQAKNKELDEKLIIQKGLIDTQQAEIERLKAESDMADGYEDALIEMTKSEAIKEFWKRFDKVLCENIGPSKRAYWKISSDGNNLVKEMTEGKENG